MTNRPPTIAEIQEACRQIREEWDEAEHDKRAGRVVWPVEVQRCSIGDGKQEPGD